LRFFSLRGSSYGFNCGFTGDTIGVFEYVAIVVYPYPTYQTGKKKRGRGWDRLGGNEMSGIFLSHMKIPHGKKMGPITTSVFI
jgi:hypothetical protein